jgi:hypothetical protein
VRLGPVSASGQSLPQWAIWRGAVEKIKGFGELIDYLAGFSAGSPLAETDALNVDRHEKRLGHLPAVGVVGIDAPGRRHFYALKFAIVR